MKRIFTITIILLFYKNLYSQTLYKFNSKAVVYGCSNILLQKISKDHKYELMIEINRIDSLPKLNEIDLSRYSRFVTVYLNKYPSNNKYVNHLCNDIFISNRQPAKPNKFLAKKGRILITKWDNEKQIISVRLTNIFLTDKSNKEFLLTSEYFSNIEVGGEGG